MILLSVQQYLLLVHSSKYGSYYVHHVEFGSILDALPNAANAIQKDWLLVKILNVQR